ncbi:glycosyltransferase family 2 protein [Balneolaceae bacterium YR4-1]|uniref:Glycosyltransferase family 2 protein n=1 Tax=Halalkalibaculum roseum TaxID=2709311 RepID=A0A6M1T8X3_9BACT|nr:glycosyltransferase family 2 protein [Halalkalibaculum roseum]NGP76683.1 glycosyltransferase family 2 protein [Halalkalibaculum roseum]
MKFKNTKKNENEPFVSIVTPVYNGEKYLTQCIESVLEQTYQNWEYVIVNNCSTDRSLEIAEKYAERDDRIRIHNNKQHLEVLKNLNHAFRQISPESKYCKVIHADDLLFPECVSRMVALSEEYPSVGLVSSYRLVNDIVGPSGLPYPSHKISGKEICRRFLLHEEYYFGAPSTLLIRSDLIIKREKVYDETILQGDVSACLDILKESDFGFVHQVLSYTRRHKDSVTETKAKKYSRFMLGYLKTHLDYAPYFLTEEEMEKRIPERINIFYVQFARNILSGKSIEAYYRHKNDLESLGIPVKHLKLLEHILKEIIKLPIKNLVESNEGFNK